jgi:hypothetical protein
VYRYRYINTQSQHGRTFSTLILEDLETDMPDVRIDKEFGIPLDQLDDEMLYQAASYEIQIAQQAYDNWMAEQQAISDQEAADAAAAAQALADYIASGGQ